VLCKNGLSNQCLESLWGTPTSGGEAAYDGYSLSGTYENRNKVGLVGANDGLLHAFHVGTWHGNATPGEHNDAADDDSTSALDESLPPFNGYYDKGTGEEIWAFLPPDMLSKIYLYVTASRHHFFVDGNPWVRDVWVDGTSNGLATARGADNVKQAQEFHTVAVIGERRGGTHFFALDVTNATSSAGTPGFLWVYPQPDSKETLEYGETYNDTLPRPPPIGPVRMAATTGNTMSIDGSDVSYREQWVAFLNGGYDPQYVRGRGVHMVDVWTGEELFDFSYSSVATDVRNNLRFPVPAAVGMVPWGANAVRDPLETNEFFFDTATFGDAGGQLWVLRFHRPGTRGIGLDKRVTNWSGARMFQMGTSSACKLCGGQPFFYMTVNVPISNGKYRLLAGTGDRFNLLDKKGGTCGPDNIRACVLRGCTVTIDQASNLFQSAGLGSEQRGLSQAACGAMTSTQTDGTFTACAANGKAKIVISACPSPDPNNGPTGTTKDVQVGCGPDALGLYSCGKSLEVPGTPLVLSNTSNAINLGNWFYSLLVFEETGNRAIFDDQTAANTYDGARLWLNQTALGTSTQTAGIVTIAATAVNPTPVANADSKGWAMYYSRGTQVTADSHVYNVNWQDERTSSGSAVLGADVYWNTNLTADEIVGTTGSCDVRKCASIQARRISTKYGADVESGGFPARMTDPLTGASVRAIVAALLVPTQSDQPTVFVNQKGQIAVGLTAVNPERGATNVGQTEASDPVQDFGILEVNRKLHACRHDQSCE
jgi:type IV pilus assembly protein PilY1